MAARIFLKFEPPEFKSTVNLKRKGNSDHGPSSSPAKLRPWFELTAKMVMGVVPGLVNCHLRGVSRVVWTSNTLSHSRGWSSYSCECRAHFDTKL